MSLSWYSINIQYQSSSIFDGYFSVDTTTNIIQSFYQNNNPTTNLLFCDNNNVNNSFAINPYNIQAGISLNLSSNIGNYWTLLLSANLRIYTINNNQQSNFCMGGMVEIFSSQFVNYTFASIPGPAPTSNICFPAGTPILTDQGVINIEKLDKMKHTITGKSIKYITQTVTLDKYLISFLPNSIGRNIPSKKTIMSKDHKIEFEGQLVPAERFLNFSKDIKKVQYNGEILFNVLLENYGRMNINGLTCETLHPENIIAKLYGNEYTDEERNTLIVQINESLAKRDLVKYTSVVNKLTLKQ
uniref:Hedgehog/Intein (Hint) domain-containing protein n=1 Tax=viral metagenome TaxID=1070528 RepID=A0A6C0IIT7_9ZZZZ